MQKQVVSLLELGGGKNHNPDLTFFPALLQSHLGVHAPVQPPTSSVV